MYTLLGIGIISKFLELKIEDKKEFKKISENGAPHHIG